MKLIIYYSLSTSIAFIVDKTLIYFVMRFFSLIFLSLFRFKASNYDIKETRVFSYINAKIDNCIFNISI